MAPSSSATPRAIGSAAARAWGGADAAVTELVELAERELYSRRGRSLCASQRWAVGRAAVAVVGLTLTKKSCFSVEIPIAARLQR